MITANFLIEWAIRSFILIGSTALLLWLLRVKDPSIRLAAFTAVVCGSLSMPLLTAAFPKLPVVVMAPAVTMTHPISAPHVVVPPGDLSLAQSHTRTAPLPDGWHTAAVGLYALVTGLLLFRLGAGLLVARKLRRDSRATDLIAEGAEVRESDRVTWPVTLGIVRPAIMLPADWREWDQAKLNAVLAHEQSHVRRKDPVVQVVSAIHRALLWHSPVSWMLHRRIVRLAEDISDDAAVAVMRDRSSYAGMLLEFMQRGVRVNWQGVAMARYGCPEDRIHRILHARFLSNGVTRRGMAAIFTLAVPLAYVTAAAVPARKAPRADTASVPASLSEIVNRADPTRPAAVAEVALAQRPTEPSPARNLQRGATVRRYMIVLGETQSGSWDSRDSVRPETLRARFGNRFAWLRHDDAEHVITDEGVLRELERAMEPQNKVNAQQDQVNRLQTAVNNLQGKVNSRQNEVNSVQNKVNELQGRVNAAQDAVSRRQQTLNRIQDTSSRESKDAAIRKVEALLNELRATPGASSQDDINRLQAQVNAEQESANRLQHEVNLEQNSVNEEQNKVNQQQNKVNEIQNQVSKEFSIRVQEIFTSAIQRGLAKNVN